MPLVFEPKHTFKRAEEFFRVNNVNVLHVFDLNPIKHLWKDVKVAV